MDGIAFNDLAIGHQVSLGTTTTEADHLIFGAISRDANPVHLDVAVAATTPMKTHSVSGLPPPGPPLAGLIGALMGTKLRGSIYLSQTLTCLQSVHIGHTVTITTPHAKTCPATPRKICAGAGKKILTRGTAVPMHSAA